MNKAKAAAAVDGKAFLRAAFAAEQKVLAVELELSSASITHDGIMGEVNEQHFIRVLRKYLPKRYAVEHGIVIDSNGDTSDQIDIVIFDQQYTPTLLDQQAHRFIPAEAVYCVLEVKPTINKNYLLYAGKKAESVRKLYRTSTPIPSAGGELPPKPLFPIIAGIVAPKIHWREGLAGQAFISCLNSLQGDQRLDCGLVLCESAFDFYDARLATSGKEGALAFFIFRLLKQLQSLGTVPAIDWTRYVGVVSDRIPKFAPPRPRAREKPRRARR